MVLALSTKIAAPTATSTLVRSPAVRWRYWRSSPIKVPNTKAVTRLSKVLSSESSCMNFKASTVVIPSCLSPSFTHKQHVAFIASQSDGYTISS
ncbi:hypothetical protein D3C71_1996420 [compost metagenome]